MRASPGYLSEVHLKSTATNASRTAGNYKLLEILITKKHASFLLGTEGGNIHASEIQPNVIMISTEKLKLIVRRIILCLVMDNNAFFSNQKSISAAISSFNLDLIFHLVLISRWYTDQADCFN